MQPMQLLVATRNAGKMREYRELLANHASRLISLDDLGIPDEVEETGDSFRSNAILKASSYARLSGCLTLSDDSGLEVDALQRAPGIYSARYGGDACDSDEDRVQLLLENLHRVPWELRTARFCCVTAIAAPPGFTLTGDTETGRFVVSGDIRAATVVGSVAGVIQYEPKGDHGFGYDPVFYLPSYAQTIAQLPLSEKNRISHRADAARKARRILDGILGLREVAAS